jgi:hypothetical protein
VGFTTGSRGKVPGKKENLWQEMMMMMIIIMIIIIIIIIIFDIRHVGWSSFSAVKGFLALRVDTNEYYNHGCPC